MAPAAGLQRQLIHAQNPDGGWGYRSGSSWTEPTALAVLALESQGVKDAVYQRGCRWLLSNQKPDGGWPPHPAVDTSTWVTSLCTLALSGDLLCGPREDHAIEWLLRQIKPPTDPVARLVYRLRGLSAPRQTGGSPWFPGTAAWIYPSAFSILALSRTARMRNRPQLRAHARQAQRYILSHRCRDGGWNHGGSPYLSDDAFSYPEITGLALLALYGVPEPEVALPLKLAEAHLASVSSLEAFCWLRLALIRHGRNQDEVGRGLPCRTTRDLSLQLLACAETPDNRLLSAFD